VGGRIARGFELAGKSFAVLRAHETLLLFPLISAPATLVAGGALFGPGVGLYSSSGHQEAWLVAFGILGFYAVTFVAVFFNVALAAAAVKGLQGDETSVRYGLSVAWSRVGQIAGWALLQTVVGLIIHALEQLMNEGILGQIVASLLNFAWSVATFFVIPVIALEGPGPIEAFKRSTRILREQWGEGLVGAAAIGFVLVFIPGLIAAVLAGIGIATLSAHEALAIGLFVLAGAIAIVAGIVSSTVTQIFRVAVYELAVDNRALAGFTGDELKGAFRPRRF
jgi:Family of unknown function (DUF6159)